MDQLTRITHMEEILDEAEAVLQDLSAALEGYEAIRDRMQELEEYYESPQWMLDYSADEAGELPFDLKRGVLSQDGVYHLLERQQELLAELRRLAREETP